MWVRREKEREMQAASGKKELPWPLYLVFSVLVAIASVSSRGIAVVVSMSGCVRTHWRCVCGEGSMSLESQLQHAYSWAGSSKHTPT